VEFKDIIKQLRLEKGISLTDFGSALGKTESACRAWELGRSKPDADTLIRIAKYFGCTTDYLLGLDSSKNKASFDAVNQTLLNLESLLAERVDSEEILKSIIWVLSIQQYFIDIDEELETDKDIMALCFRNIVNSMADASIKTVLLTEKDNSDGAIQFSSYFRFIDARILAATSSLTVFFKNLVQKASNISLRLAESDADIEIIKNISFSIFDRLNIEKIQKRLLDSDTINDLELEKSIKPPPND